MKHFFLMGDGKWSFSLREKKRTNLVLMADEDVEVSDTKAAEVKVVVMMFLEELAQLPVGIDVLVDAVALHVVSLNLHDLLLGRQPTRVGGILELDLPRLEKRAEDTLQLVAGVPRTDGARREAATCQGHARALDHLPDHARFLHFDLTRWPLFSAWLAQNIAHRS